MKGRVKGDFLSGFCDYVIRTRSHGLALLLVFMKWVAVADPEGVQGIA